jgi:hypothetical protein
MIQKLSFLQTVIANANPMASGQTVQEPFDPNCSLATFQAR